MRQKSIPPGIRLLAILSLGAALLGITPKTRADGAAGRYLYANPPEKEASHWPGRLTVRFKTPGNRTVVAYGRRYRKDRRSRKNTTEVSREKFKPYRARIQDQGRTAVFPHLPPDYYDLVVIEPATMHYYEGLRMLRDSDPKFPKHDAYFREVCKSLGLRKDRIGGWEAFFDHKQWDRFETNGQRGAVLVQQMRLGKTLAESGAVLKGCIHSIDICWVQRPLVEGAGWQVITRQQLYRAELPARVFFKHRYIPDLCGVRIGRRARVLGPLDLP